MTAHLNAEHRLSVAHRHVLFLDARFKAAVIPRDCLVFACSSRIDHLETASAIKSPNCLYSKIALCQPAQPASVAHATIAVPPTLRDHMCWRMPTLTAVLYPSSDEGGPDVCYPQSACASGNHVVPSTAIRRRHARAGCSQFPRRGKQRLLAISGFNNTFVRTLLGARRSMRPKLAAGPRTGTKTCTHHCKSEGKRRHRSPPLGTRTTNSMTTTMSWR